MFAYVCMCLVSLGIEKNRLVMDSERGVSLVDTQVWKGKKISVLCLLKTLFCAETLSPKTLILTILIFFKKLTIGETLSCGVVQKGSSFLFPLVFVDCPQVRQSPPLSFSSVSLIPCSSSYSPSISSIVLWFFAVQSRLKKIK